MATRFRIPLSPWAWPAVAALLVLPAALLAWLHPPHPEAAATWAWTLRPSAGWADPAMPWALWTAAWIHVSPSHLGLNALAALALASLGWRWGLNAGAALAWMLAWPLTHLCLLAVPGLHWYAGASGVLHAGAGVLTVWCWHVQARPLAIIWTGALLAKLCLDVYAGFPWAEQAGLPVPVITVSHLLGTLCGLFLAGFLRARLS